jgi:hypothetical protein
VSILDAEDEENLAHWLKEIGGNADDIDDAEAARAEKRRRMKEVVMFGQSADLQSALDEQQQIEAGISIGEDGTVTRLGMPSLEGILFGGSNAVASGRSAGRKKAASKWSAPVPRISFDDAGNMLDDSADLGGGGGFDADDPYANSKGRGIDDAMPDSSDPTFAGKGAGASAAAKRAAAAVNRPLPPSIKEVTFASGDAGLDWLKVSASGVQAIKHARGNVIASQPSEQMQHHSPVYSVKVEIAPAAPQEGVDAAASPEPVVKSESYDELTMFWYDIAEHDGSVYLFGKALLADKRSTTSCCVKIGNMERNLFVLPRRFHGQFDALLIYVGLPKTNFNTDWFLVSVIWLFP